jgi:hypothetical protein
LAIVLLRKSRRHLADAHLLAGKDLTEIGLPAIEADGRSG